MGTNFYWLEPASELEVLAGKQPVDPMPPEAVSVHDNEVNDNEEYTRHIGKRSAAGLYCWDCNQTLCPDGKEGIHKSSSDPWPDACPKCGKRKNSSTEDNAAMVGVRGCSSFLWAQEPGVVRAALKALGDLPAVVDEYDRVFTADEFLNMLDRCPVEFTGGIGVCFS